MVQNNFLFIRSFAGRMMGLLLKSSPAIILSAMLFVVAVYAWTEPSVAPPGGNIDAPINIGSATQYKAGALGVGGVLSADSVLAVGNGDTGGGASIRFKNTSANLDAAIYEANNNLFYIQGNVNGINFRQTDGTIAMKILNTGNVGIGTASPSEKLHVFGNIKLGDDLVPSPYWINFTSAGGAGIYGGIRYGTNASPALKWSLYG